MKRCARVVCTICVLLIGGALAPTSLQAADLRSFTASFLGGFGGSVDQNESGFSNLSWQLGLAIEREARTQFGVRLGRIDFDQSSGADPLSDSKLNYVSVGGEYRSHESLYESGLFLGLGLYDLDGDTSQTELGATLGVTGDFELTKSWTVLIELAGHITQHESAEIFATGLAGFAFHF